MGVVLRFCTHFYTVGVPSPRDAETDIQGELSQLNETLLETHAQTHSQVVPINLIMVIINQLNNGD